MVSSGQWARPPVEQGLALCWYNLELSSSTAAYLQVETCLSTAAHMTIQSCNARGRKFQCFEPGRVLTRRLSTAELSGVSAATCISTAAPRMQKLWRHSCPVWYTEHRGACHLPVSQLKLCQKHLKA